jgi:hypothetical protein
MFSTILREGTAALKYAVCEEHVHMTHIIANEVHAIEESKRVRVDA